MVSVYRSFESFIVVSKVYRSFESCLRVSGVYSSFERSLRRYCYSRDLVLLVNAVMDAVTITDGCRYGMSNKRLISLCLVEVEQ